MDADVDSSPSWLCCAAQTLRLDEEVGELVDWKLVERFGVADRLDDPGHQTLHQYPLAVQNANQLTSPAAPC